MSDPLHVLLIKPGQLPQEVSIPNTLRAQQAAVGGRIETYSPFWDNVTIVCNEEGKILNLPANRVVYGEGGRISDIIHGDFFICGFEGDDFTSLTAGQMEKYREMFRHPERIAYGRNGPIVTKLPLPANDPAPLIPIQTPKQAPTQKTKKEKEK